MEPRREGWLAAAVAEATGAGVVVGVIDSGRDPSRKDPRILPGVGLVDPEQPLVPRENEDDIDRLGHGTACIDILLQLAPEARVVPIRVFGESLETSPEVIVAAIDWAAEGRLPLLNLSLGSQSARAARPIYGACQRALGAGTRIVSAVEQTSRSSFPAVFDNVLGVAAAHFPGRLDFAYRPADAVECLGHGGWPVTGLGGRQQGVFGASFAAPQITAIVARLLELFPRATLGDLQCLLAELGRAEPVTAAAAS